MELWRQATRHRRRSGDTARACGAMARPCIWASIAEPATELLVVSLPCPERRFPRSAQRIRRRCAWSAASAISTVSSPKAARTRAPGSIMAAGACAIRSGAASRGAPTARLRFHAAEGPPLHQIPVGPVHAGIIEPGHFRFTANGETVVRLEERLGYVHKGIEGADAGAPLEQRRSSPGRVSGDSTVAYAMAFARAVEAALGIEPPPRAVYLRALMAELERLANHFGDIGAICNDASFSLHPCALRHPARARAARAPRLASAIA